MNTTIVPFSLHEKPVSAFPITRPGSVAFIPTHGICDVVIKSHGLIAPFSVVTFTGTLHARPTMMDFPCQSASPITFHGFVETIHMTASSYGIVDFDTCETQLPLRDTISHSCILISEE